MNSNDSGMWRHTVNSDKWNEYFKCPHCSHLYEHNNDTWNYVGFTGKDEVHTVDCKSCNQEFTVELSVICVYKIVDKQKNVVYHEKTVPDTVKNKPYLKVIKGGKTE